MLKETFKFRYYAESGEQYQASFYTNEYRNLMLMLFDKYGEEWGDCKGRAWCGTCHIQIIQGELSDKMDDYEKNTLSKLADVTKQSRLACQIPVNSSLEGIVFRIMPQT